jgi:hypothetical protein
MIVDRERASWGIKSVDAYERTTRRRERGGRDEGISGIVADSSLS